MSTTCNTANAFVTKSCSDVIKQALYLLYSPNPQSFEFADLDTFEKVSDLAIAGKRFKMLKLKPHNSAATAEGELIATGDTGNEIKMSNGKITQVMNFADLNPFVYLKLKQIFDNKQMYFALVSTDGKLYANGDGEKVAFIEGTSRVGHRLGGTRTEIGGTALTVVLNEDTMFTTTFDPSRVDAPFEFKNIDVPQYATITAVGAQTAASGKLIVSVADYPSQLPSSFDFDTKTYSMIVKKAGVLQTVTAVDVVGDTVEVTVTGLAAGAYTIEFAALSGLAASFMNLIIVGGADGKTIGVAQPITVV